MIDARFQQQLSFIKEIDKLKGVIRRINIMDGSRMENTAEHSWHIALMAAVLAEHSKEKIDLLRTIKMLLVHDIVEIDAGDTFAYDKEHQKSKQERETKAAARLFTILPIDQAKEYRALWNEFEGRTTPEAKFAVAMDRLLPLMQGYALNGKVWRENGVKQSHVLEHQKQIMHGSETIWNYCEQIINDSIVKGYLNP